MRMRGLTGDEIAALRGSGCAAEYWRKIRVADGFAPENIRNVEFSGDVSIGANVRIANAAIANSTIESDVLIRNVAFLGQTPASPGDPARSAFANGLPVHCIAEDGARSVPLSRLLSAQWAHVLLHCKNTAAAAAALEKMIRDDAETLASTRSFVGRGCRIEHSGMLRNVRFGEGTVVEGSARLTDVYADSTAAAPVFLGEGVSAEECVFQQCARVDGGSRLLRCFVGEGVLIDHEFFAQHSLFFANSDFALGESACSFSGPFAVSHHRATLVLTCQNSFGNFGSGSNASNHHFKLGPRHGGILRRGVRCGSGSYLLWPCDIGAFTTVVGRHTAHLDTAAFPFSLLTAEEGRSVLVPGVNLFSAGLFRDGLKWRSRDRRAGIAAPRDLYGTAVLSPYTMQFAERGLEVLRAHVAGGGGGDLQYNGAVIPASRVTPAIQLYETALVFYLGQVFSENGVDPDRSPESASAETGRAAWRDWGGMLVSGERTDSFLRDLAAGGIVDAAAVDARLREMHGAYRQDELAWALANGSGHFTRDKWKDAVDFRHDRQMRDAAKEFAPEKAYGFGVEGDAQENFLRVRGEAGEDEVVGLMEAEREGLLRGL